MASFCNQCAEEMGFEGDFEGLVQEGHYLVSICEGCGFNAIMNSRGECVSADCLKRHGSVPIEGSEGQ